MFGRRSGNIGITRDTRTPAEVSRRERGGWALDFWIPLCMALALAVGAMLLCLCGMWALRAMGKEIFWLVVALIAGGNWLYIIWMAAKYDDGATAGTLVNAFLFSALAGWFGIAVERVVFHFAIRAAQVVPLVGTITFLVAVALRYVQDLSLFGSPFVEKALGGLLENDKAPWWSGHISTKPRTMPRPIPVSNAIAVASPPDDNSDNGKFKAPSGEIRRRADLAEFVQRVGSGTIDPQLVAWEDLAAGRDYGWWGDMVDVAAMFGLVSERGGGKKVKVLNDDWRTVLREIKQQLD